MANYPDFLVKQTFQLAGTDWDFELLAVRLLRKIDGFEYLPTSHNYDVGADGKSFRVLNGRAFIVSTLEKNRLAKKLERDLTKLKARGEKIAAVRICYAFIGSEQERLELQRDAQRMLPRCNDIDVLGPPELVEECSRHSDIFEDTYRAQLDVVNRQLSSVDREPQSATRLGLRVLLAAQLSDDAETLRSRLLNGLVLQVTKRDQWMSELAIAKDVGDAIGLELPISDVYLSPTLHSLIGNGSLESDTAGLIRRRNDASDAMITTAGAAASRALEGFGAIKRSISTAIDGSNVTIPDATFNLIWNEIQKGLVDLFRKYGADFVAFVHAVGNRSGPVRLPMPDSIVAGVKRIAQQIDLIEKIKIAPSVLAKITHDLPAILFDKPSGSRDWLTHLCLSYVSACSLGLHPDALRRLEVRMRTWDVIPDTHILLSLLGRGEEDHEGVRRLIEWWTGAGGAMLAATSPTLEVVRHAKLCDSIVDGWAARWTKHRGNRHPEVPDGNVFLRDVIAVHGPTAGPSDVRAAVGRVIVHGSNSTDRLIRILVDDFRFKRLPTMTVDAKLNAALLQKIRERRLRETYESDEERDNAESRCSSDAYLLAEFAAYRTSIDSTDRQAIILTHASGFSELCHAHVDHFGIGSVAIDCERLLYTMSLMPNSTFTMKSVQAALFGDIFQREVRRNHKLAKTVAAKLAAENGDYVAAMKERLDDRLSGGLTYRR